MSPRQAIERTRINRFPRVSGDEPESNSQGGGVAVFSPRERG